MQTRGRRTGRGGAGKLRNFRAMYWPKFESVTHAVIQERNDADALYALAEVWEMAGDSEKAAELAKLADSVGSESDG